MAERLTVNQERVGSSPTLGAYFFGDTMNSSFTKAKIEFAKKIPELAKIFLQFYKVAKIHYYIRIKRKTRPVKLKDVKKELKDILSRLDLPKSDSFRSWCGGTNLLIEYNIELKEFTVSFIYKKYI